MSSVLSYRFWVSVLTKITLVVILGIESKDIIYDKENESVSILFPSSLPEGTGSLFMKYTGVLNDKMKGFYRSKYVTPSGEEKYCAVTQFEV